MFKIKARKVNKKEFIIEVYDNDTILLTKLAKNVSERDKYIFDFCDMYNTVDVEHINNLQQEESKENELNIPVIPYTEMFQLENYFDKNSEFIFNRIIECIEYGIKHKKKKIKLFQIKNSGVFVDSLKRNWPDGLRIAHEYYLECENYEMCKKCVDLLEKLNCKL